MSDIPRVALDAYAQGKKARKLGVPREKNPYGPYDQFGVQRLEGWFKGWDDADHSMWLNPISE